MSTKGLVAALIVALVLGGVALYTLRSGSGKSGASSPIIPAGERVLVFDPAKVNAIFVSRGTGEKERIERGVDESGAASWQLTILDADGSPGARRSTPPAPWRVEESRPRIMLQVLSELRASSTPGGGGEGEGTDIAAEQGYTHVRLEMNDGSAAVRFTLAARTLAGSGLMRVGGSAGDGTRGPADDGADSGAASNAAKAPDQTPRLALVPDTVHKMFLPESIRAWRDPALFPDAAASSRIVIRGDSGEVELTRRDGVWALATPIAAPADEGTPASPGQGAGSGRAGAVAELLTALSELEVRRFLDDGVPVGAGAGGGTDTGLREPRGSLRLEWDVRTFAPTEPGSEADPSAGVTVVTRSRSLDLGLAADASGEEVYARFVSGDTTPALVTVVSDALRQIGGDAARFVSKRAVRGSPGDAGVVLIRSADPALKAEIGYRRGLDGWAGLKADGSESLTAPTESQWVQEFVVFITSAEATRCSILPETSPADASSDAGASTRSRGVRITLKDTSGNDMTLAHQGRDADSDATLHAAYDSASQSLIITSGRVHREYDAAAMPRLLRPLLMRETTSPEAPGSGAAGEVRDVNK